MFWGSTSIGQSPRSSCVSYEPTVVGLQGTLSRKTIAGPPEYSDIRKGDKPETFWFLILDSPICVNEDKCQPDLNPRQEDIRELQLVLEPVMYKTYRKLVNKKVVASGTLFGAHTIHHRTPVLLMIHDIK
jgi:hypothetical protein